jgi:DNA (cytosine-5)-methyltransferase 1
MSVYYNEINPYPAQWLRNLIAAGHIPAGDVDERSIVDVRADDLAGYRHVHFFAGLGGWALALATAGWPDDRPVWTGSCPCQPFSVAGDQLGFDDPPPSLATVPTAYRRATPCNGLWRTGCGRVSVAQSRAK